MQLGYAQTTALNLFSLTSFSVCLRSLELERTCTASLTELARDSTKSTVSDILKKYTGSRCDTKITHT